MFSLTSHSTHVSCFNYYFVFVLHCILYAHCTLHTRIKNDRILYMTLWILKREKMNEQHQTMLDLCVTWELLSISLLTLIWFDRLNHTHTKTQSLLGKLLHFFLQFNVNKHTDTAAIVVVAAVVVLLMSQWWMFDIHTYAIFTFIFLFCSVLLWFIWSKRMEFKNKWWFPRHINWRL